MPTVGIIGGMGPEATLDLFQKIIGNTPARKDQEHLHVLVDDDPSIPDRTAFLLGEGPSPLPKLLISAQKLVAAGATVLCMPCNTAHYFIRDLRAKVATPFISIVESCQAEIQRLGSVKRVGLLATKGTYQCRIYQDVFDHYGLEVLPLDEQFQTQIMEVVYSVKAGKRSAVKALFEKCICQIQAAKADVIVAGCTELPLMLGQIETQVPVIDPTLALARAVVKHCQEQKSHKALEAV